MMFIGISIHSKTSHGVVLPSAVSLFNSAPANIATTDPDTYEMGTKFATTVAGSVTDLRYWRGVTTAETRTIRLWNATTQALLGSVVVSPGAGAVGWVTGTLGSPVALTIGQQYIVSYSKTSAQSYAADALFFNIPHIGLGGVLTAPSVTNGVFNVGAVGVFPANAYNATNYYADVVFQPA